ncbi:MAG: hypothetical protein KJ956_01395, partial [Actinobacteria bacterium]|nr:hypothetical protein [Actinomycetota bacterium]
VAGYAAGVIHTGIGLRGTLQGIAPGCPTTAIEEWVACARQQPFVTIEPQPAPVATTSTEGSAAPWSPVVEDGQIGVSPDVQTAFLEMLSTDSLHRWESPIAIAVEGDPTQRDMEILGFALGDC